MYTIYSISQNNKTLYVGKTINFKRRMYEHRYRKKLDKSYCFNIIEQDLSEDKAKRLEEYYIEYYKTFIDGWNHTKGEGSKGRPTTNSDGRFIKGNEMFKYRKLKRVYFIDGDVTYNSVRECAESIGATMAGVQSVCSGQRKTYKGLRFKYI